MATRKELFAQARELNVSGKYQCMSNEALLAFIAEAQEKEEEVKMEFEAVEAQELSYEDRTSLSIQRMELLDDMLEDQEQPSEAALDLEKDVNKLIELDLQREGAKKRKDWEHFSEINTEFSKLATGNPAYGKYKALKEDNPFDEFVTKTLKDREEDPTKMAMNYFEALFRGHKEEQEMYEKPESTSGTWGYWMPRDFFQKRSLFWEAHNTVKALQEELKDLQEKKTKALAWLRGAKDTVTREKRKEAIKARYKELGLRTIAVVQDELQDAIKYRETCRKEAGMPTAKEWYRRQRELKALIGTKRCQA
jgi:hypothetical protein